MSEETKQTSAGMNRAKMYQLVLFPMNNGATNVYFVLVLSYVAQFGSSVLELGIFASLMVTVMRLADAVTDPIIGALMDRTSTRIGKFRPFMILGSAVMAVSVIALYVFLPFIPDSRKALRYIGFVVVYFIWVIGYTFQTSCTRAGQTVLTNDPNQRPMFTIFNTIGSLLGMGVMQLLIPTIKNMYNVYDEAGNLLISGYARPELYRIIAPVGIAVSVFLTVLAIIGIAGKDRPEYYGMGGSQEKVKVSEYVEIIRNNKPMQRLMVAGAGCKLALAIATNTTVLLALYGIMMGSYDSLYLPMMILGYACAVPFFLLSVRTSQKQGQKASLTRYVSVAFVCYIGVLILLLLCDHTSGSALTLSFPYNGGGAVNLYTLLFILCFGVGYGAYYATADMPIPMVADCSDYETYRSGKYIPGIMGTLFSLVDKLVSSLAQTLVALIFMACAGLSELPTDATPYSGGIKVAVNIMFCIIPLLAWAATLWAMRGYSLTGARMKEIQAVNARRKAAVAAGMPLEEAMEKWQTAEQVLEEHRREQSG
ncbi:MAG: MFS transporter [Lachnospiraceae bacterium]|nr:MFS transporter [Lachnospiraceae bacterium]